MKINAAKEENVTTAANAAHQDHDQTENSSILRREGGKSEMYREQDFWQKSSKELSTNCVMVTFISLTHRTKDTSLMRTLHTFPAT